MEKRIQVTAGNGPKECNYLVHHLATIIEKQAMEESIVVLKKEQEYRDSLICSFTFSLEGENVEKFIESWLGTVCWINRSPFRPQHKRKNWFVTVCELNSEQQISLHDRDILYQTMRSSGPGGQHVNKVNTAVRAMHIPTGIIVQVMDTRSQLQNKKLAYERLVEKIQYLRRTEQAKVQQQQWENQSSVARGNSRRTFVGDKFKEI